ncbi:fez family zinc finger protein 2 [Angomonas deanei]|uniref:Zinc finger, C2H2 type, putative n=1 Tax=Angomonas deanei TaxID=59799 RepID=A0A7G2CFE9_9TRYP|nr:fez family zinc finger protein 2 [Angomonas deanei]CAD2216862.1 Zinc finger, C2H2 type, putative [Angomonas deanei]|eukprot:EPY16790.1 fez family zinc finger protein 2 [Angomonas deanei]
MEQLNKTSRRVTTRKVAQASGTTTVVTVPEIKPPPPPSAPPHKREKEKEEDEYHLWLSHQLNVPTAAPDTRPPRIMQDEEDEDQPLVRKETIHPTPVSSSPSLSQPKLPTLKQEPDTSQEGKDDNDSTQEESKSRTEICPQCGIVLTTFRSLRRHCSRAHPLIHFNEETLGRTDCPRCGEVFPTRSAYRHHRSAQACTRRDAALAEEAAPAPMIAPIAGAATKEEEEAIKKKILLSKREKCPYCQLVFIGSFRLKRHAKAVHADRPVPEGRRDCGVCGEVFPTRQDYIAHRMSKACFPDWMTGRRGTKEEDDENEGAEKRVKQEEDGEE